MDSIVACSSEEKCGTKLSGDAPSRSLEKPFLEHSESTITRSLMRHPRTVQAALSYYQTIYACSLPY